MTPLQKLIKKAEAEGNYEVAGLLVQCISEEKEAIICAYRSGMLKETLMRAMGRHDYDAIERWPEEYYKHITEQGDE